MSKGWGERTDFLSTLDHLKQIVIQEDQGTPGPDMGKVVSELKRSLRGTVGPKGRQAISVLEALVGELRKAEGLLGEDALQVESVDVASLADELEVVLSRIKEKDEFTPGME